jgi:hypothetical protein
MRSHDLYTTAHAEHIQRTRREAADEYRLQRLVRRHRRGC